MIVLIWTKPEDFHTLHFRGTLKRLPARIPNLDNVLISLTTASHLWTTHIDHFLRVLQGRVCTIHAFERDEAIALGFLRLLVHHYGRLESYILDGQLLNLELETLEDC